MDDTVVFIDEAFLSKLSSYFGEGKYLKFDRVAFSSILAIKEKLNCSQIILYISPPFQSSEPTKEEELRRKGYDNFINRLKEKEVIIREGRCQRLKVDGEFEYHQKAVDVLLSMDLTNVPLKYPNIKRIILISSDSDFVPIIKNLEEQNIHTILYTYYEKKRDSRFSRSNDLIKSVYKYKLISKEDILSAQLNRKDKEKEKC